MVCLEEAVSDKNFDIKLLWNTLGIEGRPINYVEEYPANERGMIHKDKIASEPILAYVYHLLELDKQTGRIIEPTNDLGCRQSSTLKFFDEYNHKPEFKKHYGRLQRFWMTKGRQHLEYLNGRSVNDEEILKDVEEHFTSQRFRAFWALRYPEKTYRIVSEQEREDVGEEEAIRDPTHCPARAFVLHLLKADESTGKNHFGDSLQFFGFYEPIDKEHYKQHVGDHSKVYDSLPEEVRNRAIHATYVLRHIDMTRPRFKVALSA